MTELEIIISKYYDLIEPAKSAVYSDCKKCGLSPSVSTSVMIDHIIRHETDCTLSNNYLEIFER